MDADRIIHLVGLGIMENGFERLAEDGGDAESGFERWRIFSEFDGVHGLASDVDFFGQLLLGHLAVFEAQAPDFVANPGHVSYRAGTARFDSQNARLQLRRE